MLALERYIVQFPDSDRARLELARAYFARLSTPQPRARAAAVVAPPSAAALANLKGAFMGPAGDHLGVSINATAGSAKAQTVQIYSCAQANC